MGMIITTLITYIVVEIHPSFILLALASVKQNQPVHHQAKRQLRCVYWLIISSSCSDNELPLSSLNIASRVGPARCVSKIHNSIIA